MEQNYLNAFVPIVRDGNQFVFGVGGVFSGNEQDRIELSERQQKTLYQMTQGESYKRKELIDIFGSEIYELLAQKEVFVSEKSRTDDVFSRTDQFYKINRFGNVREVLKKRKVLILGCGGIGTHVAWNMVTAGVGELILLDFDKVENSNLNRQLLYNRDDIGCYKIEVLKEKLQKINPDLKVTLLNRKIERKEDLDEVCRNTKPDLIIKSLDSPEEFPFYLDEVCSNQKIPYISGTSASTHAIIGPTYIPGQTAGYTEFFIDREKLVKHVGGLSPSLSLVMYDMSNELSIEAFKVLTRIGKLKFGNCMIFKNVITGDSMEIAPKQSEIESELAKKRQINTYCLIAALFSLVLAVSTGKTQGAFLGAFLIAVAPVIIFKVKKYAIWAVFQNISWYMLCVFMVAVIENKVFYGKNIMQMISLALALLIVFSISNLLFIVITELLFGIKRFLTRR